MKKIIVFLLVVSITAAVAVGGTVAYLRDTDSDVNVRTIGYVHIRQDEHERVDPETGGADTSLQEYQNLKPLIPMVTEKDFDWKADEGGFWDPAKINNEHDKIITVTNTGDYKAYVRTIIAFEAGGYAWEQFQEKLHLNINATDWSWEWLTTPIIIDQNAFFVATATYKTPLAPGQTTSPSLRQIALDSSAGNADVDLFGADYLVLASSQAIQVKGFHTPQEALTAGFETITAEQHPFLSEALPCYIHDWDDFQAFAARGGYGILMEDLEITTYTVFNRPDTLLDMNGHTIYNNMHSTRHSYIFRVDYGGELTITGNGKFIPIQDLNTFNGLILTCLVTKEGSKLTIENGYFDASHGDYTANIMVQCQSKGTAIINGGEFIRKDCPDAGDLIYSLTGGHIDINGGLFRNDGASGYVLNAGGGSPITVRGGTFVNHRPGVDQDPGTIRVAEGYKTISEVREDGNTYYTVVPEE